MGFGGVGLARYSRLTPDGARFSRRQVSIAGAERAASRSVQASVGHRSDAGEPAVTSNARGAGFETKSAGMPCAWTTLARRTIGCRRRAPVTMAHATMASGPLLGRLRHLWQERLAN